MIARPRWYFPGRALRDVINSDQVFDTHSLSEIVDWRRIIGLGLPAAFQPPLIADWVPMTSQCGFWTPALACRAAKTRQIVIGMHGRWQPRRGAP